MNELPETAADAVPEKRINMENPKMIANIAIFSGKFSMKYISKRYIIYVVVNYLKQ